MKLYLLIPVTILGLLFISSCKKPKAADSNFNKSSIIVVLGPKYGFVGHPVHYHVTLQGKNGCAVSGRLQDSVSGNSRTIKGSVIYNGDACAQKLVEIQTAYSFTPTVVGTYELKFLKLDGTTHTILVETKQPGG